MNGDFVLYSCLLIVSNERMQFLIAVKVVGILDVFFDEISAS